VLPGLVCCSPLLPTLLATFGVSGVTLFTTTGSLQYFFAVHETAILAGSLALLVLTATRSLRRIARATCLTTDCTITPTTGKTR
jgi:hypothetical protein